MEKEENSSRRSSRRSRSPRRSSRSPRRSSRSPRRSSRSPRRSKKSSHRSKSREKRKKRKHKSRHRSSSRDHEKKKSRKHHRRSRSSSKNSDEKTSKEQTISTKLPYDLPTLNQAASISDMMVRYPTCSLQEIMEKMKSEASGEYNNMAITAPINPIIDEETYVRSAKELYVGNLPQDVMGPQLQDFLGTMITEVGLSIQGGNPIVKTWISTYGNFGFCEFRTVEECNLALMLNGLSLMSKQLICGRPKTYTGTTVLHPKINNRTATALTNLSCSPTMKYFHTAEETPRALVEEEYDYEADMPIPTSTTDQSILMKHIPAVLTQDQIQQVVEPFGELEFFQLLTNPFGHSTGAAIFQYTDPHVTAGVIEGLNGFEFSNQKLHVMRAPVINLDQVDLYNDSEQSPVLRFSNVVTLQDLNNDEMYDDVREDVELECSTFGPLLRLEIPRVSEKGQGFVFVQFSTMEDAIVAKKACKGRTYGDKMVEVIFYSKLDFENGRYEKHDEEETV